MKKNKKYGLIGKDIDYSFSKTYFSNKFKVKNLNCEYLNFDLTNLHLIKSILEHKDIFGLNVTIPFKEGIIDFLDEVDEIAKNIGAVNTIKKELELISDGIL